MLPDRVSNPGPLTYESGALPTALRGPAVNHMKAYGSRGLKIYTKGVDYLTKNSATPIYGKSY